MGFESYLTGELLKISLGGLSGAGFIIILSIVLLHIRSKANGKRVDVLEKRCNGQDSTLATHTVLLTKIETNQENVMKGQETMFKKMDKLIEMHMKGG